MFSAEIVTIFGNLISNAVKAAGENGAIRASGRATLDGRVMVRVENTGVAVDLDTAEQLFDAYVSTSTAIDVGLAQGMGLGLTITRALVGEYAGSVKFVAPNPPYATAVEVSLPETTA